MPHRPATDPARMLEAFFRHTITPLVFLDRGLNFIRVNAAYARACALDEEVFVGRNHFEMYPSPELEAEFRRVVATGEPYHVEARPFRFPDHPEWGTTWWDLSLSPILDGQGRVDFLVFALDDVTARVRAELALRDANEALEQRVEERTRELTSVNRSLEAEIAVRRRAEQALAESERRYRSLFDGMTEGFALHEILCNRDGDPIDYRFLDINPSFERLTGLSRDQVVGHTLTEVLPGEDPLWVRVYGAVALTGEPAHFEHHSPVLGRHFEVFAFRPAPGQFAAMFVDVTARRQTEMALARNAHELRQANAQLEEFAYAASHDLKAPLRAVANLAACIEEDAGERLDPQNRGRLGQLRTRVMQMHALINGLLAYGRVGREQGRRERVALEAVIAEVLAELSVPEGWRVEVEPLPTLTADPTHVRQIFRNLIGNAFQHHDLPRGALRVRSREEPEAWVIDVADDGPGIPREARESVFKVFCTLGRPNDGTGIGLALVKKLMLLYGGSIELEANQPRGCLFRLRWPKG